MEFYDRFDRAIEKSGLSEAEVLRRAGYGPDKIRNSRRRSVLPTDIVAIIHIAKAANCSALYLLEPLGIADSLLELTSKDFADVSNIVRDEDESHLLEMWRRLREDERAALLQIIEKIAGRGD